MLFGITVAQLPNLATWGGIAWMVGLTISLAGLMVVIYNTKDNSPPPEINAGKDVDKDKEN